MHCELIAMVAPDIAILVGAVSVTVPPHTVADAFGTVKPVGRVSVNPTPFSATVLSAGFVMVKVSEVVVPIPMPAGLKALEMEGGPTTLIDADAILPVPPSTEVTLPVVLF